MKKENYFDYFHFNLYKLKNKINKFPPKDMDEIYLIIFNSIIDSFPNEVWFKIKNNFFTNLSNNDPDYIIIYTITAYNLGDEFNNVPPILLDYFCTYLTNLDISPYKLPKYADFLLNSPLTKIIKDAYDYKGISPEILFGLIIVSFDIGNLTNNQQTTIINSIRSAINEYQFQIFNGNYTFFNVYRSLKTIWDDQVILDNPTLPIEDLELLLRFDEIPDTELKIRIKQNFELIEKNATTITKKVEDSLTVIANFAYDLPFYQPKKTN